MSKLLKAREGGDNLPPECWQLIFNHLNGRDLKAVSLACKSFLTISNLVKESLKVVHPKVGMLSRHLKRFPQIKKIDFSHFEGDLDEAVCEVARSNISLESLDISNINPDSLALAPFKTEGLRELASNPKMKNLNALSCKGMSDNDFLTIANWFPNLEELNIVTHPLANSLSNLIECLAYKLKHLKKIDIGRVYSVSDGDASLLALSVNCKHLTDVTINDVTESCIGRLIRNRPNLEALTIGDIENDLSSTITIANSISHAKALTSLEIINMDVSDELLMAIGKAKLRLENFGISYCINNFTVTGLLMVLSNYLTKLSIQEYNFVDEDIKLLSSGDVGNLTHIVIGDCQVTNSTLFLLLSKCPSLVDFSILMDRSRRAYLYVPVNNSANGISLSKYHKIQHLHLSSWKFSDELDKQFGLIFPNLKVLDLSYCDGLTSICVEAFLKSCKYITKLILKGYGKGKIIEANSDLLEVNLEVLTLPSSSIDDEGIAVIRTKCPRLADLDLTNCKNVTTKSIKQIVQSIKTLTYLDLLSCDRVDYGDLLEWMLSTGNFASLKELCLGHVNFTEELKDQFLHHGCLLS